jgi:hypothetical protein
VNADAEARGVQLDVRTEHAAQLDIADPVVKRIGPVHPALLHQVRLESRGRGRGGHLPGVVGLDPADGDQRVGSLRQGVGNQVFELPDLVAAEGEAAVAVITLGPDFCATQMLRQARKGMDRRGPEGERIAGKRLRSGNALRMESRTLVEAMMSASPDMR